MPTDASFPSDIPADEMADYLRLYLDETGEQLDQLVQVLLALEATPTAPKLLNEAFRLVHSIKGSAALMGLDRITTLVHHLESHFELLRSGVRPFDNATTDVALRCIDHLRECNARLRRGEPLPGTGELLDLVKSLDARPADAKPAARPATATATATATAVTAPLAPPGAAPPASQPAAVAADAPRVGDAAPAGDAAPGADAAPPPRDAPPGAAAAAVGRHLVTVSFRAGLPMADVRAELVLARLAAVGTVVEATPPRDRLPAIQDLRTLTVVLDSAAQRPAIRSAADADGVEGVVVDDLPPPAPRPPAAEGAAAAGDAGGGATVRVDVARLDALLNLAGELLLERARLARLIANLAPTFRKSALPARLANLAESLRDLGGRVRDGATVTDMLADLEERIADLDEQVHLVRQARRDFGQLGESGDRLTRVSDALQRSVLLTRMVPVGPLFNRFKRSVRDIAAELGKKVRLEMIGERTELDKRMIDELGDPLVHLIRNAVDHGIEPADVRVRRGKPETATVSLEAVHRGNNVLITIRDDGGGIDTHRIRQRVVDRGLVTAEEAATLDDRELIEFIWQPGFSTAGQVSGISGRGVGMDIVRTRITALSGAIDVRSTAGAGTEFVIRLPLTLAIAHCLLFRVPQGVFAAPLDGVREIVAIRPGQVVDVRGRRSCDISGEYLPLVTIDELFAWAGPPARTPTDGFAVVLESGSRSVALAVERLLGREELVVKSLADNFSDLRGLGGAGILADGTVCLLLDVASTTALATRRPAGPGPIPSPTAATAARTPA